MVTKRVLTGIRPTGNLHLGHYVGALKQWIEIQQNGAYECYFLVADVQAFTTHAHQPELLAKSIKEVVLDWLSVGLDPAMPHVHFVLQSEVQERYALSSFFNMIAKYSEVMRNPTLKSELESQPDATMGFMCYPVDQIADIYMINPIPAQKGDQVLVPVGEDQRPHLEFARDLAIRFNNKYGEVFVPCDTLVGQIGRLVGVDGQGKMGKSTGNAIFLTDSPEVVKKKIMRMWSDPTRQNSPALLYHQAFNQPKTAMEITQAYQVGEMGDRQLKEELVTVLQQFLVPIRERRALYQQANVTDLLVEGTLVASIQCKQVVTAMKEAMKLGFPKQ